MFSCIGPVGAVLQINKQGHFMAILDLQDSCILARF